MSPFYVCEAVAGEYMLGCVNIAIVGHNFH